MVHRAPPHPGHLAAGWPPDVGPDPPPRPAPAAIDAKRQCPRRPACHRVPRLARLYRPGSHQCHLRTARGRRLPARYRPGQLLRPRPAPLGRRSRSRLVRSRLLMPYAAFAAAKTAGASWKDRTPGNPAPRPGQNIRIHHDNGESISDLAVSLSLGDRCTFRLATPATTVTPALTSPCPPETPSSSDDRHASPATMSPGSTPAQAIPGPASPAAASTSQCA